MKRILIKNGILDGSLKDIFIEGNRIKRISNEIDAKIIPNENLKIIEADRKYIMPTFVNMHTHAAMTLTRGYKEDVPLFEWLDKIWKLESGLDDELVYWGTRLACLEMIQSGTTFFNDQYFYLDATAKAVEDSGIRALLTYVFLDGGDQEKAVRQRKECEEMYEKSKKWGPNIIFGVSIHAHYTVCDENMLWASDFCKKHDLKLHTHLLETRKELYDFQQKYGVSPVRRLDDMEILNENVIAAHSLWLSQEDIEILGKRKVTCVHNVNSNLKLASGYKFKYNELKDSGCNVTLGTDGCGSSNNLDMLETMKTTALLQKAWRNNPAVMPIDELLATATVNGAKTFNLDIGEIKEGNLADLMLINTNSAAFIPNYDFLANFIYSANSSCIDTLICDGNILMEKRKVKGEKEILENAQKAANELVSKLH
ncbi:MAG: amidohydrolase [Bacteroidales bacterium]